MKLSHFRRCHPSFFVVVVLAVGALLHGPIEQLHNYHAFADQAVVWGVPHFADVLSNLGFALVALWGWYRLAPMSREAVIVDGWGGYRLFLIGVFLTAIGSSYYHLAPDNARLVWDRLPIALTCAGLLAGVWGDTRKKHSNTLAGWLGVAAVLSVAWWRFTDLESVGDLRPYLLLQALPILLIPLDQWLYETPRTTRWAFSGALILYVIAKFAELGDHEIAALSGGLTGHTLKHLLATGGVAVIVKSLVDRAKTASGTATTNTRLPRPQQYQKCI